MSIRIAVLVAGIADVKWRATELGLPLDGAVQGPAVARKLSPFDEAALECALKLRDADASVHLRCIVASDSADAGLLHAVSAYRPSSLQGVVISQERFWDAQALAIELAATTVCESGPVDLVLVGREFGDFDDGVFAPSLAQALDRPFVALAQEIHSQGDGLVFVRERSSARECINTQGPIVASMTNAKSNRLRYPLMKNVMAAKREPVQMPSLAASQRSPTRRAVSVTAVVAKPRNEVPCRMVPGTEDEQARAVADFLGRLLNAGASARSPL
ncbi:MAG: electron transfer flavoprotein subunit beta [Polaromonas sp.]|uniref:electron transfer flavoprotein subunit beta/FixA family protein n=1 Tax=Polaromonas sp. TaxID=1869339 RepID=UPI0025F884C6|nr:hypothetical protein [Polaromonas sp.]MBI2727724.1 electron transfer flavoprotein subunit beta [Polaromonas sp.]